MLYTNVTLTLISLVTLPFLYIATYIFKEKVKVVNEKLRDKIGELNAFVQEHLMGFKIVKAFAAEEKEENKFKEINKEFTALNIKSIWYYSWFFPVLETLIAISIGLVVSYVAINSFETRDLSVGVITSFCFTSICSLDPCDLLLINLTLFKWDLLLQSVYSSFWTPLV